MCSVIALFFGPPHALRKHTDSQWHVQLSVCSFIHWGNLETFDYLRAEKRETLEEWLRNISYRNGITMNGHDK